MTNDERGVVYIRAVASCLATDYRELGVYIERCSYDGGKVTDLGTCLAIGLALSPGPLQRLYTETSPLSPVSPRDDLRR